MPVPPFTERGVRPLPAAARLPEAARNSMKGTIMTASERYQRQPHETPLEEGLRRYAPRQAEARRVAVSDFLISLLHIYGSSGGHPRT